MATTHRSGALTLAFNYSGDEQSRIRKAVPKSLPSPKPETLSTNSHKQESETSGAPGSEQEIVTTTTTTTTQLNFWTRILKHHRAEVY
ncbi:hypothetical protein RB195_019475 [Necator americanus]|uniref:Uncharacterized protein n=1 Tax=Necator americanus TaxID=51031 RepID=A0ABR1CEE9_NECAM